MVNTEGEKSMYMNRFLTGAVIGGALGVLGAAYALATREQKKEVMNCSKRLMDRTNDTIHKLI